MRERSFSITAPTPGVALDSQGKGTIAFAVTNSTARSLRGQMQIRPLGETKAEWLRLQGASEISFAPSETHQVTAEVQAPLGTAPGKYRFRLDACSTSNPDDDYTEGPVVSLDIGAAPPPKPVEKKPFPRWIIFVVSAIILIGLSVWLLQSRKETGPPPTPTPTPAMPTPTGDADTHTGADTNCSGHFE